MVNEWVQQHNVHISSKTTPAWNYMQHIWEKIYKKAYFPIQNKLLYKKKHYRWQLIDIKSKKYDIGRLGDIVLRTAGRQLGFAIFTNVAIEIKKEITS